MASKWIARLQFRRGAGLQSRCGGAVASSSSPAHRRWRAGILTQSTTNLFLGNESVTNQFSARRRIWMLDSPVLSSGRRRPNAALMPRTGGEPTATRRRTSGSCAGFAIDGSTHTPLAEIEPEHSIKLGELLMWYATALDATTEAAASMERGHDDGAPNAEDLQVELSWLVEDAVAGIWKADKQLEEVTWRQVERGLGMPLRRFAQDSAAVPDQDLAVRVALEELQEIWQRRIVHRIPLQYLLGRTHWRDLILAVGPGCLIPRPETELLIDFAVEAIQQSPELMEAPWADLGTGSGAIAVGIGDLLRQSGAEKPSVWAVDASGEAASWARLNVERNGLQAIVKVVLGNWGEPLEPVEGRLGGIVSNPPYIPGWKLEGLQAEVGAHEPSMALDGGPGEGLVSILEVLLCAAKALKPGGFLAIETEGRHQTEAIRDFLNGKDNDCLLPACKSGISEAFLSSCTAALRSTGTFKKVEIRSDYRGVGRFLTCYKS